MKESIKKRIEAVRRGEVPNGYRRDKLGIVPTEWEDKVLGDILTQRKTLMCVSEEAPLLSFTIEEGVIDPKDKKSNKRDFLIKDMATKKFALTEVGDIIYNPANLKFGAIHRNSLKRGVVSPIYGIFYGAPNSKFMGYFLHDQRFIDYAKTYTEGSVEKLKTLSADAFLKLKVTIPSLPEQEKIAEILATCDRVIELKQQLLEEKRRQKQWLMQKLLDPNSGVRMPGFENSTWEKATMASLFTFGSSMAKSRDELSDEGDLYLHYGDIHANERYCIDAKAEYESIPKYDGSSPEKTHLHNGDVVFIDASEDYDGISKFVVIENCDGLVFISGLHTIPCRSRDDRLTLHFKRYCFQTYQFKKQMAYYANGMKVYGISEKDFAKVEVVFPSQEEQRAIANVLDAISMNIELLEKEIEEIGNKKKALMQLLLTGLVRV